MTAKISGLPAVTVPDDTDEFEVNQGLASKKMTLAQIRGDLVDDVGAEAAASAYIDGLPGTHDATTVLLGNNTFGEPPGGGGGGGGLTTELDAATAVTVGSGTDGEHHVMTSDSAITLTLDAQATVGMESAFTKAGSGAVSVAMEAGAGYWVPSDDIGGSPATAGFTMTGYGYFLCIRNTGGSAAQWLFVGQSSLPASITSNLVALNSAEIYGALSPWQTATGSMASAASARSWNITGNLTAVPITNGWWGKFRNISGSGKTVALASGSFVSLADGDTGTTLTLADDRGCVLHGDGTNSMVDGVVAIT